MKTSMDDWRKFWDRTSSYHAYDRLTGKTLDILSEYAHFFKFPVAWGGRFCRFFTGHWNTHHGEQIQRAIEDFYHFNGEAVYDDNFHAVEYILACVKKEIGHTQMNPRGDLAKILRVIKEKTNVDYLSLDADKILSSYHSLNNKR
jgi:hypothetical protein